MNDQNQPQQPAPPTPTPAQPANPYAQPAAPAFGAASYGQPQQPGQQTGPQPAGYYQPTAPQSNGKAVAALVCGILAVLFSATIVLGIVLGIVAIVLAVQAVKATGRDGKATGGKVLGIVGIVLSGLILVLYITMGLGALVLLNAAYDDYDSHGSSSISSSDVDLSSITEGDQQMEAAISEKLDLLKNKDAAIMQQIAADADEQMYTATDSRLSELGIDPVSFVEWMLTDFDYQLDGVYDNGDGTATAYANVTLRDSLAFATTFMNDAQAAVDAGEMQTLDEAGAKARLGELYRGAMDKTSDMTTLYVGLDLVKTDNSWQVDQDSWSDELDYLFGL